MNTSEFKPCLVYDMVNEAAVAFEPFFQLVAENPDQPVDPLACRGPGTPIMPGCSWEIKPRPEATHYTSHYGMDRFIWIWLVRQYVKKGHKGFKAGKHVVYTTFHASEPADRENTFSLRITEDPPSFRGEFSAPWSARDITGEICEEGLMDLSECMRRPSIARSIVDNDVSVTVWVTLSANVPEDANVAEA